MVLYEFKHMKRTAETNYIFQTVKDRKLSDIYHAHDFYEWIIVLEGNCEHYVNETQVHMEKNMCALLCPGDRHKFIRQSADVQVISLSVEQAEMQRFADAFQMELKKNFCTSLSLEQSRSILNFYQAYRETDYKMLLANLMKIYADAFGEAEDAVPALQFAVTEMMQMENLRQGTPRLIELSGYSKSHLQRLMHKHYGVSLHEFVLHARMEMAYNLLTLTNMHMEELSEQLGYASFSHFNKIFKQNYGITPAALRKKYNSWTT